MQEVFQVAEIQGRERERKKERKKERAFVLLRLETMY